LWIVAVGALAIGLLLPFASALEPGDLELRRWRVVPEDTLIRVVGDWADEFIFTRTYQLSTLVGIVAAYMALRKS
jgi:hypothetical protein